MSLSCLCGWQARDVVERRLFSGVMMMGDEEEKEEGRKRRVAAARKTRNDGPADDDGGPAAAEAEEDEGQQRQTTKMRRPRDADSDPKWCYRPTATLPLASWAPTRWVVVTVVVEGS